VAGTGNGIFMNLSRNIYINVYNQRNDSNCKKALKAIMASSAFILYIVDVIFVDENNP
jgi:hypothetical protein